jgi:magnesium chelatase family protein
VVLLLDEFPHFRSDVIEAMRQPLESGEVTIARGEDTATYPARSLVVLAANPCPCGNFHGLTGGSCDCTEVQRAHYRRKLSGPILDRVDIWMEVRPQGRRRSGSWGTPPESSADVRARVTEARLRQARRYRDCAWQLNSSCPGPVLAERWPLEPEGQRLVDEELGAGRLTRRGLTRVQRLAWTVADCAGVDTPGAREAGIALALRSDDATRALPADVARVAS